MKKLSLICKLSKLVVKVFVKLLQVARVNFCATQRTNVLGLDPLLYALSVEVMLHVAAQRSDFLAISELLNANRAFFLGLKLLRVKCPLSKPIHNLLGQIFSLAFVAHRFIQRLQKTGQTQNAECRCQSERAGWAHCEQQHCVVIDVLPRDSVPTGVCRVFEHVNGVDYPTEAENHVDCYDGSVEAVHVAH